MNYETASLLAFEAGFDRCGPLRIETVVLKPEVRQMCEPCRMYGKRWSCPPGCGTLEQCREAAAEYTRGILVQSIGHLEDSLDVEAMMETERLQKERFLTMYRCLRAGGIRTLALGSGCCTVCTECTFPDAPCRFPDRMVSSMEAFGMEVSAVCKANGLSYYDGPDTIVYTGCFLF